jgi:hypothetical protein
VALPHQLLDPARPHPLRQRPPGGIAPRAMGEQVHETSRYSLQQNQRVVTPVAWTFCIHPDLFVMPAGRIVILLTQPFTPRV